MAINKKKIVLLDVDGTILDNRYQFNIEELTWLAAIAKAKAAGFYVGLNSDSPYESLRACYDKWQMNGPIISEKGATVWTPDFELPQVLAPFKTGAFPVVRNQLRLVTPLKKFGINYFVWVDFLNFQEKKAQIKANQRVLMVNQFRRHSLSFYAMRNVDGNNIQPDFEVLEAVRDFIKDCLRNGHAIKKEDLDIDSNRDYGICIFHHVATTKKNAITWLNMRYPDYPVFMVGNSMSDYCGPKNVTHLAVGGASQEFKDFSAYTATADLTEGVVEILKRLTAT
ncbi:MAG: HAD hydrolase family protein [Patescibacteria group bacterium]|jgi:hydroxymethylpyrimidine pyrophosphatase-like HAD family hydrolase